MKINTRVLCIILSFIAIPVFAQKIPDSLSSKTPMTYEKVISAKVKSHQGMFVVHQQDENYYLEIPDSLLNRDILMVSRIAKSSIEGLNTRFASYAGDKINERVITFEKGPGNKIFMRGKTYSVLSNDSTENGMYRSVISSSVQSILAAFPVKAFNTRSPGTVIDITLLLNADNALFSFPAFYKKLRNIGAQQNDRSYIKSIRAYPTNVEIRVTKTFASLSDFGSSALSYELNSSLVLLPRVPMQVRYTDRRVGYFSTTFTDFDTNPQGVERKSIINRWRLEPKEADKEKYFKGELVEPKKQIIFYIDPATPKKWVPYLIQGVNDWQSAFEKAGFKRAIIAKEAPLNDSTWNLEDASHSAIVYKPSEEQNASGPHIHDPRSGEILESHINWYHNVMRLLQGWYMIQAGAIDPRAGKMTFDDQLMGELIRFVSSHEVGHTLGLAHNYGSSSTVPSEKLRDKKFVEAFGHTPSIMDYARFNYVAQPEDHINSKGIYPRIGDYDFWAIEWGYKLLKGKTALSEVPLLGKLTANKLTNNRLWFGPESNRDDPRSQSEDLGDNAMISSGYGIKNLKRILAKLPDWTKSDREGHEDLSTMYGHIISQFTRYMGHVTKNIGGVMATPKSSAQTGTVFQRNPASKQEEAMAFLDQQLFDTPKWLLRQDILDNIGQDPMTLIAKLQVPVINRLVSNFTINKLIVAEATDGQNSYKISDLFIDMNRSMFKELNSNSEIDVYRRNLQKVYINKLISLINPPAIVKGSVISDDIDQNDEIVQNDMTSVVKVELKKLNILLKQKSSVLTGLSKYHLDDLSERIEVSFNKNAAYQNRL
ncbi:MAG: zinc-dependent metalloprotease [Pedobacter sp.]